MDSPELEADGMNSCQSEEELEPLATVDVLPVREEDFFPEGSTQDAAELNRSSCIMNRVSTTNSNQPWNLQEHQLRGTEPESMWTKQRTFFLGAQPSHQLLLKVPNKTSSSQNELVKVQPHSPKLNTRSPDQHQESRNAASPHQDYFEDYRFRNERIRLRNRLYARRYRLAHADLVRQRQREYVQKRRECKKLALLGKNHELSSNIPVCGKNQHNTSLLSNRNLKNKSFEKRDQEVTMLVKSKKSEINEENEILILN